ncbi:MAG: Hsp20 family protein [Clostridiales bacterium]|nr:Hsp20 family protein [Clostridiales bacterium]
MFNSLIPFSRSNNLDTIFSRFFDDSFNFPIIPTDMKVDIKDSETDYLVEAEIPGVNKEQIKVDYQNNYLTISVQNQNEINEEKENYIRRERSSRRMSRSFYIENINNDEIKASYENGILKVSLPKSKQVSTHKTIEIQ